MKNINEKLEISQWLYEQGFKNDLWCDYKTLKDFPQLYDEDQLIFSPTKVDIDHIEPWIYTDKPFFTTDRCLELLPNRLGKCGQYHLIHAPGLIIRYKNNLVRETDPVDMIQDEYELHELIENNDTNLAALRLLKSVIEKGYLKGENDGTR